MFKSISELDAHFRYTNVSVFFSVFSLCNCLSIYSKSLRVLTIFRCLIFKVLFRSFFPFLSAFSPLSVSLFFCRPERNSCYYIALRPFCQHFFWIFFDFFSDWHIEY